MTFIALLCYLKAELLALDPQKREWASLREAFMRMQEMVQEDEDPSCRWTSGQVFVDKNLATFGFCQHSFLAAWEIHVPLKIEDEIEAEEVRGRLVSMASKQPW